MLKVLYIAILTLAASVLAGQGGAIKGSVKLDGKVPAPRIIPVPRASQIPCNCKEIDTEELVVDKTSKGIKWVIVRVHGVKSVGDAPKLTEQNELNVKGCRFEPHAIIVQPGIDLVVINAGNTPHNIRLTGLDLNNPGMNKMMAPTDPILVFKGKYLAEPEIVQVNCDIHPWMKSFVVVHDPRYAAITAADGEFEIKNIPPGAYKLNIWHEKFGGKEVDVVIKACQTTDLGEIKFVPKPD